MNLILRVKSADKGHANLELNPSAKELLKKAQKFYKTKPEIKEVLNYFTAAEYAFLGAFSQFEMNVASYHVQKERLNTNENGVEING